ncbi:hypothetical protein V7161_17925 [Neobacillus drentensis]|uniref:hypothetical protein n=1 Tax=Neobacillus drentensis TaxID=220684 RepID=UPI0030033280
MKVGIQKDFDYIELGKESMIDHNGNIPKRLIDDQAEESFWSSMLDRKKRHLPDPYAQVVQQELLPLLIAMIMYWKSDLDGAIIPLPLLIKFES